MTVITTSTAATATAYSNQRKTDATRNGVRWTMFWDGTSNTTDSMHFRYSTDGITWTDGGGFGFAGTGTTHTPNGSLFIDLDDYAHAVYEDRHNGFVYYRRGTPNAGRTTYTWGAAQEVRNSALGGFPDVVAHREGSGWMAHVVLSNNTGGAGNNQAMYFPITITSSGTVTVGAQLIIGGSYSVGVDTYPSIDFNHTGDGKTVAGGTPHLYAAWSAGATGAGKGIRFKKATYSGGSWTWGTEREIDSTSFANAGRISSQFDGTRTVVAYADSASTASIKVRDRDAADTTTTTRTPPALSDGVVLGASVGYDNAGNIYLGAIGTTSADPQWVKYDRAAGTWGTWSAFAAASTRADTLAFQRGHSSSRIGAVYTDGTASPYSITYDAIVLNSPPNAPILTAPADGATIDRNSTQRFDHDFSDPDPGDSQSAQQYDVWSLDAPGGNRTGLFLSTGKEITPNTYHDFPAGTFPVGHYEWTVSKTWDSQGAEGPGAPTRFFTAGDAPPAPTITAPINGATFSQAETVTWSAPAQSHYQLRILDGADAVVSDTGEVASATARSRAVEFPVNNVARKIQVRVKDGGLWSPYYTISGNVSWTPPATPAVTLTSATPTMIVDISNPPPADGEPPVNYNDVYVTDPGKPEERRATLVPPNSSWVYRLPPSGFDGVTAGRVRVVAVADNGVTSSGSAS